MPIRYDLHTHSIASDGTLPPEQLVQRACACGVGVLALTDHDTTEGVACAATAAQAAGLRLVPGVEISVTWNHQTIHVLGLHIECACRVMQDGLAGLRAYRDWRAAEIARSLQRHGIEGAYEGARAHVRGSIISRSHFARFLVQHGYCCSVRDAFKRYLTRNGAGYVPGAWAGLEQVITWIRDAGGAAVIAHPARYRLSAARLRQLIGEFKECGGIGLEVVSGSHAPADVTTMAAHAQRYGLFASCGSDYHGPENPWVDLGCLPELPHGCTPVWRAWEDSARLA
ncbi:MAG: PHP domain-containing protein [Gammaproteobacteria bacterium]|nr:PHP domain-containing protein [Gammaproteobacteria bacterium]